jgi:phytoene/squalene synthetase
MDVTTWQHALTAAGITGHRLRADCTATRALLVHQCGKARTALRATKDAYARLPARQRPIGTALTEALEVVLTALERRGAAVDRSPVLYVRPGPAALFLLPMAALRFRLNHAGE